MTETRLESTIYWNDFYQDAWKFRTDLIKQIYEDGEHHPLRVLKRFESIFRLSQYAPGHEKYEMDSRYSESLQSNVSKNDGKLSFQQTLLLPTGVSIVKEMAFLDNILHFSPMFDNVFIKFLSDFLRKNEFDAVVELGSGLGANLVRLYYEDGPKIPYYAGEFSESGTECAQFFSEICKDFTIIPFRYDHTKPDLSIVKENKRVFVFSIHSIEQVPEVSLKLFEEISGVAEHVTCMHIEPFGWQLANLANSMTDIEKTHMRYAFDRGWNKNLMPALNEAYRQDIINLRYVGKNVFPSSDASNPSSLAHWETP